RTAIDFLTDDHKRIARLFDDFDDVDRNDPQAVQELVETTCIELQIHSILEEELFYPAVRAQLADDDQKTADLLNEAQIEHESADALIARLQELEPDDALYAACFKVLAAYVQHHVREEENSLFPCLAASGLDLQHLAEDLRLRREALFAEMEADDELETDAPDDSDLVEEESSEEALETLDLPRTRH
ncbi:MAG: hemerythrin domain-containing protein, partial [Pseudomonadota bacterium]